MAAAVAGRVRVEPVRTERRDLWWLEPTITVVVLGLFVLYTMWAMVFGTDHYYAGANLGRDYISPFYSPCIANTCQTGLPYVTWWFSPAWLIFYVPLAFRGTCYYYRKAYYRSFFWAPPACAVPDAPKRYAGETRFPWIIQNIHRYAFWPALIVVAFLWWDAEKAFYFPGHGWGLGLGTLVLVVNAALLSLYSFTCHSFRHMIGGFLDLLSHHPLRYRLWRWVSFGNEHHMLIAWCSLVFVAFSDVYVRLVSAGVIADPRWF
jgi:hypothetical protein